MLLTCWISRVGVGAIPPCCRRTAPHTFLVRGQIAHVGNASVAVAAHSAVGELGHGVGHVVSTGHRGVVAHRVLLHARLGHLRLPVGSQRRCQVPRALHATKLLVRLFYGAEDVCHWERCRVLWAQRHGSEKRGGDARAGAARPRRSRARRRKRALAVVAWDPIDRLRGGGEPWPLSSWVYCSQAPGLRQTRGAERWPAPANNSHWHLG